MRKVKATMQEAEQRAITESEERQKEVVHSIERSFGGTLDDLFDSE
jgi:hypothetical protein